MDTAGLGLGLRKVGAAFVDHHHLPVDDGLLGFVEGAGDLRKPFGPVQPVAGVDLPPLFKWTWKLFTPSVRFFQPAPKVHRHGG
jgi:hypothetical protein